MTKTVFALALVCFAAINLICVQGIAAQFSGDLTINSEGHITPQTAAVKQTGSTYILTADVSGSITIEQSNIVFDGNGYTLRGGISISNVANVTLRNLTVTQLTPQNPTDGIVLNNTSNVLITNNTVTEIYVSEYFYLNGAAFYGLRVTGGASNVITGNVIADNTFGAAFFSSQGNAVIGNNFVNNGLGFWEASNNTIFHNNFLNSGADNGLVFLTPNSINAWDNGYPAGGNYWSNYETVYHRTNKNNVTELDHSGIGDIPYFIDAKNKDRYPLLLPFEASAPEISIISPQNSVYNASVPLTYTVDEAAMWVGYSLDGQQTVTITGNTTMANLTNGLHSITLYANDTFGTNSQSPTVTFTVAAPPSIPTETLIAVALAVIIILASAFAVYFMYKRKA